MIKKILRGMMLITVLTTTTGLCRPIQSKILRSIEIPTLPNFNAKSFCNSPQGKIFTGLYGFTESTDFESFLLKFEESIKQCPAFNVHVYEKKITDAPLVLAPGDTEFSEVEFFLMMVYLAPQESIEKSSPSLISTEEETNYYIPIDNSSGKKVSAYWRVTLQCWMHVNENEEWWQRKQQLFYFFKDD